MAFCPECGSQLIHTDDYGLCPCCGECVERVVKTTIADYLELEDSDTASGRP